MMYPLEKEGQIVQSEASENADVRTGDNDDADADAIAALAEIVVDVFLQCQSEEAE